MREKRKFIPDGPMLPSDTEEAELSDTEVSESRGSTSAAESEDSDDGDDDDDEWSGSDDDLRIADEVKTPRPKTGAHAPKPMSELRRNIRTMTLVDSDEKDT